MELQQIKTFILISESGSLAAAARILRISSAAVSKQLSKLEENLGLQLVIRSTRHLELTEVGKNYYEQCKRIIEEVEAAEVLISEMKAVPGGDLKVFSGRHFASTYIIPHLKEFLERYPKIRLHLELGERIPHLVEEAIDVLIGMSLSAGEEAVQKKIATTRYCFCASPDYLKRYGTPKTPTELLKHRYITHSMRQPDNLLIFSNKERIQILPYLFVNDAEAMLNMAKDGLGVVKLHHYVVSDALIEGTLREILSPYSDTQIPLYVAYPQRRYIAAKTRCFIDFIHAKIEEY